MQDFEIEPCSVGIWKNLNRSFFPRNVETLTPIQGNLLSADAKDIMQKKIRAEAGKRLDEHTRVLPVLMEGNQVQLQNLRGKNILIKMVLQLFQ